MTPQRAGRKEADSGVAPTPSIVPQLPERSLTEIVADENIMPPDNRKKGGKHIFDTNPDIVTAGFVRAGIIKGLLSSEGQRRLGEVGKEWTEAINKRAEMRNDLESYAQSRQQFLETTDFFDKQLGINRDDFMNMITKQLNILKAENPMDYSRLPDDNPLRSIEGLRITMQEIIPQAFAAFLAMPTLTSEQADHIVNAAVAGWDQKEQLQKEKLREELLVQRASTEMTVKSAKLTAEERIARLRSEHGPELLKGEQAKQELNELKAQRPVRILVGLTAPVFRWPIEAIKGIANSMEKFATEKPATFVGGMVLFTTVFIGGVEYFVYHTPPSVPLIITGVTGISLGALAQGLWDKYGKKNIQE